MTIVGWLRMKLHGPPDPVKVVVVEKINHEQSRLNGATEQISHDVAVMKTDRERRKSAMSLMLDDALRTLGKRESNL